MPLQANTLYLGVAALGGCCAAICDLRNRTIPNRLNITILICGILLHCGFEAWHGLLSSVLAALLGGGLFLVLFLMGGMRAGDVKLMTALGAVVGLPHIAVLLLATAAAGGLLAVGVAVFQRRVVRTLFNLAAFFLPPTFARVVLRAKSNSAADLPLYLPYGVAIAAGALTVFGDTAFSLLLGK